MVSGQGGREIGSFIVISSKLFRIESLHKVIISKSENFEGRNGCWILSFHLRGSCPGENGLTRLIIQDLEIRMDLFLFEIGPELLACSPVHFTLQINTQGGSGRHIKGSLKKDLSLDKFLCGSWPVSRLTLLSYRAEVIYCFIMQQIHNVKTVPL